ncbi:MAG: LacI family DNA-binding transcriptional regulator [Burkholderiales bacterium]
MSRATIKDVARAAGVSTVTVSRVANAPSLVRSETRARVEQAMHELGYAPNAAAQSMRTKVSRTIGFMVPDLSNYPNAAVAKAAEATLADAGYYMLLTDSDHDPHREARFLRLLRARQVDGIILYLSNEDDPEVQATIQGLGVPVVVLDRKLPFAVDTVFSEHQAAIRATVRHLAAQGRRRLALLSLNLRIRPRRERARGFRAAVRAAGLKPDEQHVVLADVAAVHAAVERVLDATPRPDALLVDGSRLLAVALQVLRRSRLAVPREIAVIAIDAVEPLAAAMPELIGIARDFSEIGRRAAQLMIDRLTGALTGPPVSIVLPSRSLLAEAAASDPPALQVVARLEC